MLEGRGARGRFRLARGGRLADVGYMLLLAPQTMADHCEMNGVGRGGRLRHRIRFRFGFGGEGLRKARRQTTEGGRRVTRGTAGAGSRRRGGRGRNKERFRQRCCSLSPDGRRVHRLRASCCPAVSTHTSVLLPSDPRSPGPGDVRASDPNAGSAARRGAPAGVHRVSPSWRALHAATAHD